MDGKSEKWRKGADDLLATLAVENKYVVADMMIIFLESAGYGLKDWSPLGGVFKRAAKKGIIKRIDRPTKQALWVSQVYHAKPGELPQLIEGEIIRFKGFGKSVDHVTFKIAEVIGNVVTLERHD
jgi:hypothetical protein